MGISRGVGDFAMTPSGVIVPFAGSNAPSGWLLCAGQAVSRTQYAGLFLTISTTYGVGDGSTTFNLPDLRGRTIAGVDNMGGSAASRLTSGVSGINATTLGAAGGVEGVTLTAAQSGTPAHSHANTLSDPSHAHGVYDPSHAHGMSTKSNAGGFANEAPARALYGGDSSFTIWNANTGIGIYGNYTGISITNANNTAANAGSAHTNTQPTIVLNYIIRI